MQSAQPRGVRKILHWHLLVLVASVSVMLLAGCRTTGKESPAKLARASNEEHMRQFGDSGLPRKIGTVANMGLQIPTVSPDGKQMLYLQTDRDYISPMTLLGSPEPEHTPTEGSLSIWLRPTPGSGPGRRISHHRWAHSPVWSRSGRTIAYVVNAPPESFIVHLDLTSGLETTVGLPGAINCLARFDGDDQTLLFCSAKKPGAPFRIYRQHAGKNKPIVLTPEGPDCIFPVCSDDGGQVLCAQADGDHLNWVKCGPNGTVVLAQRCGSADRPTCLQTWAGIASPLSPDRNSFLFYDTLRNLIAVFHADEGLVRRHRTGGIAACWLTNNAIALATSEAVFVVNTATGMSPQLFNGQWIPCRYVPSSRRLIMLRRETSRRFSIVEIVFKQELRVTNYE